jgi:hypothetical protein
MEIRGFCVDEHHGGGESRKFPALGREACSRIRHQMMGITPG